MSHGFNSNLQCGDAVYHVQTEARDVPHPVIDTVVLSHGRVLHRRSTSYEDLLAQGVADASVLRVRVEHQHRDVLEALQSGFLPLEALPHDVGIEVKLRNADSWLAAGQASLEVEVCSRSNGPPVADAEVAVSVEGAAGAPAIWIAQTDVNGRARVRFSMPPLADPAAAALVIRARTQKGQDQLRYRLKAKVRDSETSSR